MNRNPRPLPAGGPGHPIPALLTELEPLQLCIEQPAECDRAEWVFSEEAVQQGIQGLEQGVWGRCAVCGDSVTGEQDTDIASGIHAGALCAWQCVAVCGGDVRECVCGRGVLEAVVEGGYLCVCIGAGVQYEATGREALVDLLNTDRYQSLTVNEAINRYALPTENNTTNYQTLIREFTGLDGSTGMNILNTQQLHDLAKAIGRVEGWREGVVTHK